MEALLVARFPLAECPNGSGALMRQDPVSLRVCAPWVATGNPRGRCVTAASSVNRGQHNDRHEVDDGADSAPEASNTRGVLVRTDRSRARSEPKRRYRQDEPARSVALQEYNEWNPAECASQNCDAADKP